MLTKKDIDKLKDIFATKDDLKHFPTRDEVREIVEEIIDEKLKLFPTKEEYFSRMDKLSGEIHAVRQSQELHAQDHSRIDDRLTRIEHHLHLPPLD